MLTLFKAGASLAVGNLNFHPSVCVLLNKNIVSIKLGLAWARKQAKVLGEGGSTGILIGQKDCMGVELPNDLQ